MRLPEDKIMLRDSARAFLDANCDLDWARKVDESEVYPMDILQKTGELGWLGLPFSEEYGGSEGDSLDEAIILEQMARALGPLASGFLVSSLTCGKAVRDVGTPEQLARWIPGIADGTGLFAFSLTEPQSGSDAAAMHTRATRVAGGWVLNGQKVYTTGATISKYLLVYARSDDRSLAERGDITTFVVPTDAQGLQISPIPKLGLHPIPSCFLFFDSVFVPDDDVLGEPGTAWRHVMSTLNRERLAISGMCTGMAQAALEVAMKYAGEREQFGVVITEFGAIQQHLAEIIVQVERARAIMLESAVREMAGTLSGGLASIAKVTATDAAVAAARIGMQVLGGYGYTMEYPMQRFLRDALIHPIAGGSNEIQRNVITDELVRNGLGDLSVEATGKGFHVSAAALLAAVDPLLQEAMDEVLEQAKNRTSRWDGQALKNEIADIVIRRETAVAHIGSSNEGLGDKFPILALIEASECSQALLVLARRIAGEHSDAAATARVVAARETVEGLLDSVPSGTPLRTLLYTTVA